MQFFGYNYIRQLLNFAVYLHLLEAFFALSNFGEFLLASVPVVFHCLSRKLTKLHSYLSSVVDILSFAKVSNHFKNTGMSIWQLKLIIASSTMTKHMYTYQNCQFFPKVQCNKFILHSLTVYRFVLILFLCQNDQKFISPKVERAQIVGIYKNGLSQRQVSKQLSITKSSIQRAIIAVFHLFPPTIPYVAGAPILKTRANQQF